ncbi:hypothetical protein [Blastopirellula marina]|uniref:Uncharacterized protein n=1 Tax=Blastopirellula marina TaxID=124 RepID=A0A2S8GS03_9BACT|nr:hypothetical protein [Blastopirellula marina]PQO47217.1 hypothetical protein C5Y93_04035 [Blastopirellula marina]
MPKDLTAIATDDLIAQAAGSRLEKAIARSALPVSLALTFAAWYAVGSFFSSGVIVLGLGFLGSIVIPLAVFAAAKYLAEFRRRDLLRELDRRFGRWSLDAYVRYYQQHLRPGQVRCIFRGSRLPGGRRYWGYLELDGDEIRCVEATESAGRVYQRSGPHPWSETERKRCELTPEQQAEIGKLVASVHGVGRRRSDVQAKDGFPAAVAVIYGDDAEPTVISSNLGGLMRQSDLDDGQRLLALIGGVVCNEPRLLEVASQS